jgi:hypothetical protein
MTQQPPQGPPEGWQPPPQQQAGWRSPQPGWGPPPPHPPLTAGRAFLIMVGAAVGAVVGFFAPFLPGFLAQALLGVDIYGENPAPWLALAMLVTIPCGAVLGGLWARQRTRR